MRNILFILMVITSQLTASWLLDDYQYVFLGVWYQLTGAMMYWFTRITYD